jgi:drug/metabolite transporter (DMT)-like permease
VEQQTRAYLFAAVTVFFWSTVASAFKLTLGYISSEELLLYSTFFSLLILGTIVVSSGRLSEIRRWPAREFLRSALLGFLNPFLYYLVVFKAYSLLPAQEALTLNFIWPIVLVLFAIVILRQRITSKTLFAMLISFSGALVISTRGDVLGFRVTNPLGAGLALGSSVVWALYWVYGTKDTRDAISRLCVNFIFGFAFVALYMLLFSSPRLVSAEGLLGSLYVGAFEMGITYVVWLYALRLSRTTAQVSSLIYLTPFLSLVVVHVVVGERIYGSTVMGLILIVGGILLQHYGGRRSGLASG